MDNEASSGQFPEELRNASTLQLFREVAQQDRRRSWALLFPANQSEMGTIYELVDCGLIKLEPGVYRFDLSGRAKSAEVVCELTEAGKLAAAAVLGNPSD